MVYRNIESALHGSWNVIQTHTHQNTHPYFIHIRRAVTSPLDRTTSCPGPPPRTLTLIGAVGVRLVAVVSAVVVSVAGPVLGDAAATIALELNAGAGVATARLVTVVPAVVVCTHTHTHTHTHTLSDPFLVANYLYLWARDYLVSVV
jgi:hypothetical protein